jgi:hypothetical protein
MKISEIKKLARLGAEVGLERLEKQREMLLKAFPDLNTEKVKLLRTRTGVKARRKRRTMTLSQRKAVSVRMKRYWAQKRKADK